MSFFIKDSGKRKRNLNSKKTQSSREVLSSKKSNKKSRRGYENEEIDSDLDSDLDEEIEEGVYSSGEEETAQEKRLRLAKEYLKQLEEEEKEKQETDDVLKDAISHRLRDDVLEQKGRLRRKVAASYQEPSVDDIQVMRGHQLPVTCLVITPDDKFIFSGSKDCSIFKWSVDTGKKVHVIPGGRKGTDSRHKGHTAHVLSLAISSDGKFLASGCRNKIIHIWNPETLELLHTFRGHRDAVSGLTFRRNTHQLFSASHDRAVKIWEVGERAYVETLFGHQDAITGIHSLSRERAVTAGGRDGTVRIWKIPEESQLIFHGHLGSIDCISLINEEHFISGADDSSIALWSVMKKKPICIVKNAHISLSDDSLPSKDNWIVSVAALQNTDLVATAGSCDGCIKLWQCGTDFKSLTHLYSVPLVGYVNTLQFSSDGSFLVAGIGYEHRLGRWQRLKQAKNKICVIQLRRTSLV